MSGTDAGRQAVYAAEIAAFEGTSYENVVAHEELERLAESVFAAAWWPCGRVSIVAARSDAESSTTRQRPGGPPVVRLAAPQATPATLVHELAHVLAGVGSGHGALFRRAHIDLAEFAFGEIEAGWLVDAYASMALEVGERRWSPPTRSSHVVA